MAETDIDRECLNWMLSEHSVMTPLTNEERRLVARRQASIVVAEAARQIENWRQGRPYLFREQRRPEPTPRKSLGDMFGVGHHRQPGKRLGEMTAPQLLTERRH